MSIRLYCVSRESGKSMTQFTRREAIVKLLRELNSLGAKLIFRKPNSHEDTLKLIALYQVWSQVAADVAGEWAKSNYELAKQLVADMKENDSPESALNRLTLALAMATQHLEQELETIVRDFKDP